MTTYYIYKHTCTVSRKSYIGKSIDPNHRWRGHQSDAKNGSKYHFHNAIRKYGAENFVMEILYVTIFLGDIYEKEIQFISKYDTYKNGYNMTHGGEHPPSWKGRKHSSNTKRKISEARKNSKPEQNSMYGKIHTEETKKKMSESAKNKPPMTEETRIKIGKAAAGRIQKICSMSPLPKIWSRIWYE